jgi:ABC-2 type transport system ATP-binding protein
MVLNLIRPDGGSVKILGLDTRATPLAALRRIGALVEAPSMYPHLTGRENLTLVQRLKRCDVDSVARALDLVALTGDADRPAAEYSLGMKQRLGLATALLGDPPVVILDEPTNGLDPAGVRSIRTLLRTLAVERRTTVFLSSHVLSEVEATATHVGIIDSGRLRFEGTLEELHRRAVPTISLRVDNIGAALETLRKTGVSVRRTDAGELQVAVRPGRTTSTEAAVVNRHLVRRGIDVHHLTAQGPNLEQLFMNVTSTDRTEVPAGKPRQ